MIRTLLATTAIATLISTGAFAQTMAPETTDPGMTPATEAPAEAVETPGPQPIEGHLASNIIGENVYNSVADDAENIGTVNDIVLDANGQASLVIVGVGGFLGLGQKDVALEYATLEWAQREDGTAWLVAPTTREQLEQQEAFDRDLYDPQDVGGLAATGGATGAAATTDTAADTTGEAMDDTADAAGEMADDAGDSMAETADDAEDAMTDDTAAAPAEDDAAMTDDTAMDDDAAATDDTATAAIDRTTLTEVDSAGLSADELIGTTVYGANEENVGSINDVILEGDSVDFVTVDVGGFLGLGAKTVAVDMDNLAFMTDEDGETYLYTSFTQEQLEAQPEYDEATFADARDEQLLVNPAN